MKRLKNRRLSVLNDARKLHANARKNQGWVHLSASLEKWAKTRIHQCTQTAYKCVQKSALPCKGGAFLCSPISLLRTMQRCCNVMQRKNRPGRCRHSSVKSREAKNCFLGCCFQKDKGLLPPFAPLLPHINVYMKPIEK